MVKCFHQHRSSWCYLMNDQNDVLNIKQAVTYFSFCCLLKRAQKAYNTHTERENHLSKLIDEHEHLFWWEIPHFVTEHVSFFRILCHCSNKEIQNEWKAATWSTSLWSEREKWAAEETETKEKFPGVHKQEQFRLLLVISSLTIFDFSHFFCVDVVEEDKVLYDEWGNYITQENERY